MSDRVRFATTQIAGSTPFTGTDADRSSGFCGFPFPWRERGLEVGTAVDAITGPLSLADAAAYYWRIRKWRVTGTLAMGYNPVGEFSKVATTVINQVIDMADSLSAAREYALIGDGGITGIGGTASDTFTSTESVTTSGTVAIGFGLFSSRIIVNAGRSARVWRDTDPLDATVNGNHLYYPTMGFSVFFNELVSDVSGPGTSFVGASSDHEAQATATSSFSLNAQTLPFGPDYSEISILTNTLSVSPYEYWPYADSRGNPIWDSAGGFLLRNPNS